MKFIVDWQTLNFRIGDGNVYYYESDIGWDFYMPIKNGETMCAHVPKHENQEQDIMFFDRYINSRPNMIRVMEDPSPQEETSTEELEYSFDAEVIEN